MIDMFLTKVRVNLLFFGDLLALYSSLFLTLLLRYGKAEFINHLSGHLLPFSIIFIIWVAVFYLSNLYSFRYFRHDLSTVEPFALAIGISLVSSIAIFYAFGPFFEVAPKSNLLIFTAIFTLIDYFIRLFLTRTFSFPTLQEKVILVGDALSLAEINKQLTEKPEIGYRIAEWKKVINEEGFKNLLEKIKSENISKLIIGREIKKNPATLKMLYGLLATGVEVLDFDDFYEKIFHKVPTGDLEEGWFVEEIRVRQKAFDSFKRALDLVLAIMLLVILSPLIIIVSVLIKLNSSGKIIYSQKRIGRNEKEFTLYKFRTMKKDAEKEGPKWAEDKDPRTTSIGKILRHTHFDEVAQLWNILKGDLSFVGPRPERPEFVSMLRTEIPYYDLRHIVKPGLTGWAQISYRYGSSVEDAKKKLEYDIYYIKNRSFVLDILIIFKTIRLIFKNH